MTAQAQYRKSKLRDGTKLSLKSAALACLMQGLLIGGVFAGSAPTVFAQSSAQTQESPRTERHKMMRKHREAGAGDREWGMKGMLAKVGATGEQQARIADIMRQARNNTQVLRQKRMEAHKTIMELFAKPAIDRAAIEAQRAEAMRLADAASTIRVKAMADAAEVLTPGQRARLREHMQRHRHGRGHPGDHRHDKRHERPQK